MWIEHIRDHQKAVQHCTYMLKPQGRLIVLAPAYTQLYCGLDRELGHHRRYTKESLTNLLRQQKLTITHRQYFNMLGLAGWFFWGKIARRSQLTGSTFNLYNLLVPLARLLDKLTGNRGRLISNSNGSQKRIAYATDRFGRPVYYLALLDLGHATIHLLQTALAGTKKPQLPFSIVCLAGLSALVVIGSALSIWLPLGGWGLQLILLLSAFSYIWLNKTGWSDFSAVISKTRNRVPSLLLALLLTSLLLLLVLGAWEIVHPDTLAYHAQAIRWIEEYKAVPGLVHLHMRYGLQNDWFIACALFGFPFTHTPALTFINTVVAAWYLLFMVGRISESWQHNNGNRWLRSSLYFLLLVYSFWDLGCCD